MKLVILFLLSCYNNLTVKNKNFMQNILININSSNKEGVKNLIKRYKDLNLEFDLNLLDETGQAPIHHATSLGDIDIVKELIENGANIDLKNILDETPLIIASEMGYEDLLNYLLSQQANPDITDKYNTNALIANIETGNCSLELLKTLIGTISLNQTFGLDRQTIAHLVCKRSNIECLKFLINLDSMNQVDKKDAILNRKNAAGDTPFHLLIKSIENPNIYEIIEIIKKGNVDIEIKNNNFRTVQDIAVERNIEPLIQLFHSFGLDRSIIENSTSNILIKMIKSFGNIELDEIKKDYLQENLDVLFVRGEDFTQGDVSFLKVLAATLYSKWSTNNISLNLPERINLEEGLNRNENIDLNMLISLINEFKEEDLDEDLKANILNIKNKFITSIRKIINNNYTTLEMSKVAKMKLKKLCSILPNVIKDNDKKIFIVNTLLRQFNYCAVGAVTGLDQALLYVDTDFEKDLEKTIHNLLEKERKNSLLEAVRKTYPIQSQQVHFDHQVIRDFAYELKIALDYTDPYDIEYNYDKNLIIEEFSKRYTPNKIIDLVKRNLTNKIYDYLKELSGDRNIQLTQEDQLFFDEDYIVKDDLIKGLLIYMGYLK